MRWAIVLAGVALLGFGPAWSAEEAPDEKEIHRLAESVRALQYLGELDLSAAQVQTLLPWLKKAEAAQKEVEPFDAMTLGALKTLLEQARDAVIAGKPIPQALRREIDAKWGELEERRSRARSQLQMGAWAVVQTLTPQQTALLSEPEWRRDRRAHLGQLLDHIRALPPDVWNQQKGEIVRKVMPEGMPPTAQGPQQLLATLEQVRAQDDEAYAAGRPALVEALVGQLPAPQEVEPGASEAERQEWQRNRMVKRLAEVLSAPGAAAFLEARHKQ